MENSTIIGPQQVGDGCNAPLRGSSDRSLVSVQGHGSLVEPTLRSGSGFGGVYTASTGVAGVAPGTVLSTTPPFTIYNPPGSRKLIAILHSFLGYISGTLGAGSVVYAASITLQAAAPVGGTVLTPTNNFLGGRPGAAQVFQGATLPAVPTILRPAFIIGGTPTTPMIINDRIEGSLILAEGSALSLQEVGAAGAAPLVLFGMYWEELPPID